MTNPYADMSYDELNAYIEATAECLPTDITDIIEELDRKSAVMTAICKLAAELDAEGWVLVPREPLPEMIGAWYRYKNGHHYHDEPPPADKSCYGAYRAMIAAAPPVAGDAPPQETA